MKNDRAKLAEFGFHGTFSRFVSQQYVNSPCSHAKDVGQQYTMKGLCAWRGGFETTLGRIFVFPLLTMDHCDETIDNDHLFFNLLAGWIIPAIRH